MPQLLGWQARRAVPVLLQFSNIDAMGRAVADVPAAINVVFVVVVVVVVVVETPSPPSLANNKERIITEAVSDIKKWSADEKNRR